MIKKFIKCFIILALFFCLAFQVNALQIFKKTVISGDSFQVEEDNFTATYRASSKSVVLKGKGSTLILQEQECVNKEQYEYCFTTGDSANAVYKEGKEYMAIPLTISLMEPRIVIERAFSTTKTDIYGRITIDTTISNIGEVRAENLEFVERIPNDVRVVSTTGQLYGKDIKLYTNLMPGAQKTLKYIIEPRNFDDFILKAKAKYSYSGKYKIDFSDAIKIDVLNPIRLWTNVTEGAKLNEMIDYKVVLENNDPRSDLIVNNFKIEIPRNLQVASAPQELEADGKTYYYNENIKSKQTKEFILKLKSSEEGDYELKASGNFATNNLPIELEETDEVIITWSDIIPILEIEPTTIKSNSEYTLKAAIKNLADRDIMSVLPRITGDLLSKRYQSTPMGAKRDITLVDTTFLAPDVRENLTLSVVLQGEYEENGVKYDFSTERLVNIIPVAQILEIEKDIPLEAIRGEEINITTYAKNIGNAVINDIEVADILPRKLDTFGAPYGSASASPGEQSKAYSYVLQIPPDYSEDIIVVKTILNAEYGNDFLRKETQNIIRIVGEKKKPVVEEKEEEPEIEPEKPVEEPVEEEETEEARKEEKGWLARTWDWLKGIFT